LLAASFLSNIDQTAYQKMLSSVQIIAFSTAVQLNATAREQKINHFISNNIGDTMISVCSTFEGNNLPQAMRRACSEEQQKTALESAEGTP
jgi:hypothetical protein